MFSSQVCKCVRWVCPACNGENVPGTDQCRQCGGGK